MYEVNLHYKCISPEYLKIIFEPSEHPFDNSVVRIFSSKHECELMRVHMFGIKDALSYMDEINIRQVEKILFIMSNFNHFENNASVKITDRGRLFLSGPFCDIIGIALWYEDGDHISKIGNPYKYDITI